MTMFPFWLLVAVLTYSTQPGGGPPFERVQVNLVEWSDAACQARIVDLEEAPKVWVKALGEDRPTWAQATVLTRFACAPYTATKD